MYSVTKCQEKFRKIRKLNDFITSLDQNIASINARIEQIIAKLLIAQH